MPTDLSIIIVGYNTRQLLQDCLTSIYQAAALDNLTAALEVLVIDNGSTDGSVEMVRSNFPQVTLTANTENRYFSAAYTQGIMAAEGKYVLAMNPDMVIQGHTLAQLLAAMESDPTIGAATTTMFFPDGRIQQNGSKFVTFSYLLLNYTFIGKVLRKELRRWNNSLWYTEWDRKSPRHIDVLPGSCIIALKTTWMLVGGFDARMLMYFSDDYVSRSVQKLGLHTVYLVTDGIIHYEGASTRQQSAWALRIYLRDLLVYTRLVFGWPAQLILALCLIPTWFVQRLKAGSARIHPRPPSNS